ncbi:PHB depolymerase family esterase [Melaminivora sp.]|uniref:extracellular catalytic domain type 1 short-chain-length polyhydroxyalkanoate depolymerase n=1 Tax=Melaminivora sp. TaxID=1933032 RepID=UPI0028ABB515|nr:PHB depolymerase family esterase [Melaminivora sp.]
MNHPFHDMLGEAARLTQGGNLMAATELIQRALRGGEGAPAPGRSAPPPQRPGAGRVLDVESRVIDEPRQPAGQAPADAAPAEPAPSSGAEQWLRASYSHQGRQLAYRLYVPPGQPGQAGPRPLVLMLHGCTQDADDFAAGTRMNALAREAGMLVLYPEQNPHANPQRCWNWFKPQHQQRGRGEPALLASLTQKILAEYGADPARVYVAGLSAGGAMADILGRAYPELFAAVGVHSGLVAGAATDLPSALAAMRSGAAPAAGAGAPAPRPLIVLHGDADSTVHPANGAAVAGAAPGGHPAQTTEGRAPGGQRFTRTIVAASGGGAPVEYWQLHGAGHAWSGGSAAGSFTAGGVDASAEMLRFFLSHRQPPGH